MTPETGPPSGMEASLAKRFRAAPWTLPGLGRPSTTLICENGMFGSSLSSQRSVGGRNEESNVKSVVFLRSPIQERDELIQACRPAAGTGKSEGRAKPDSADRRR